jgi:hypothetical protein
MATAPICSYCRSPATLVTGAQLYPRRPELAERRFWECADCQAWVGCHTPQGDDDPECPRPLGTLADASLRRWRNSALALFDPIWQSGQMTRSQAYEWLAREMGLPKQRCHIGGFNEAQCKRVAEICAQVPADDAPVSEADMQAMREFAAKVAPTGMAPKKPSLF